MTVGGVPASSTQYLALLLLFGVPAAYFTLVAVWRWLAAGDLMSKGKLAEGQVFGRGLVETPVHNRYTTYQSNRVVKEYYVTFIFEHDGKRYEHTQRISARHYERIKRLEAVQIRYMPNNPDHAQLAGRDADSTRITQPLFTALLLSVPTVILAFWFFHSLGAAR
jgi:hypothetical protein